MIKAGSATDKQHAVALWKTAESEACTAGLTLAGFATHPMPGCIHDDAVQEAINFAAYYLQMALIPLLDQDCVDLEVAKKQIGTQLSKLNDSISYLSRKMGQGIYLAGTVCYIAGEQYICQAFGNARIYRWEQGIGTLQSKLPASVLDGPYITDAIGGKALWTADFCEGTLPANTQLLCVTAPPPEDLLSNVMSKLIHTNQTVLPVSIYKGIEHTGVPIAVLTIAQAVDYRKAVDTSDE